MFQIRNFLQPGRFRVSYHCSTLCSASVSIQVDCEWKNSSKQVEQLLSGYLSIDNWSSQGIQQGRVAREFSPKHARSHAAIVDNDATKPPIVPTPLKSYHGRNTPDQYNIYDGHECHPSPAVTGGEAVHDDIGHTCTQIF